MKSKRQAVTDNSGLLAVRPVFPWFPAPGRESWHCRPADLIPSCCRMLVGRGSDSGRAVTADPGLQKPAEKGAHRLRQSQLVPCTPKARQPATMAIAVKQQQRRQCRRPRPRVFTFRPDHSESRPRGPAPKVLPRPPVFLSWSPTPGAPPSNPTGRGSACPPE